MGLASPSQIHFGSCDSNFLNSDSSKFALHALERSSRLLSNATSARFKIPVVVEIWSDKVSGLAKRTSIFSQPNAFQPGQTHFDPAKRISYTLRLRVLYDFQYPPE